MKKLFLLTALAVAVLGKSAFAADFPITAVIPAATTVNFIVSEVTPGPTPAFAAHPGNNLTFDMGYLSGPGIWVGKKFFAIDLSPANGANPAPGVYGSISFSYSGQTVPAGQAPAEGLNRRATLAAVRVNSNATETVLLKGPIGSAFASLNNASVAGGFLRVYVGTATGETGVNEILGSVPFTNADKPGTYAGTLTITATLI